MIAAESVREVALRLKYTSAPAGSLNPACSQAMAMAVDAHLHAPLGNRTVVNGDDDVPLLSFDARHALHPAQIPAGYTLLYASPVVDGARNKDILGCTQVWEGMPPSRIQLTQIVGAPSDLGRGSRFTPAASVPITVRGHRGVEIAPGVIQWTEGDQAVQLEWETVGTAATTAAVIALADSSP
ncbi:hypothetical protein EDD99_3119 [Streptomyces sp. 846.5]|nr:hypothetical protein [Streptomyces sp. 846.5]TDU04646.1 hypothetical protein EDD99_3119 [Streptomyces sp. 846.5]